MEVHSDAEKAPLRSWHNFYLFHFWRVWVHNRAYGFIFCFIFSLFPCSLLFSGFGLYPSILIFLVDQKANNRRTRENHEILNGIFLYELITKYLYAC